MTLTPLFRIERPARSSAPRGRDVVLVHSFATSSDVWRPMMPMVDTRHRLVAVDLRNHGRSPDSDDFSLDDCVADIAALIDELNLDRPVLVGSSVGAAIAYCAADRLSDRISAVLAVGGPARAGVIDPVVRDAMTAMCVGLRDDPATTARAVAPTWFGPLVGPAVHEWIVEQMLRMRAGGLALADSMLAYDPIGDLTATPLPVHHLHGALDAIPASAVRELTAVSSNATLTVLDDVAHMPHIERPGWFAGWLGDRVEEVYAAAGRRDRAVDTVNRRGGRRIHA